MSVTITKRARKILQFAVNFLEANLDDFDDDDPIKIVGRPTSKEFAGLRKWLDAATDEEFGDKKIVESMCDSDLEVEAGDTVIDVLDSCGAMLDSSNMSALIFFQVEGDARWWCASIECIIDEADCDSVRERIEREIEGLNLTAPPDEAGLEHWRDKLKQLTTACDPPSDPAPGPDPSLSTFEYVDSTNGKTVWVNARTVASVRAFQSREGVKCGKIKKIRKCEIGNGVGLVIDNVGRVVWRDNG